MDIVKKAVVTVLGYDCKGIIARVSGVLFTHNINILDISQTIVSGFFNMIMLVDLSEPDCSFGVLSAINASMPSAIPSVIFSWN